MAQITGQINLTGDELRKIVAKAVSKRMGYKIDPSQVEMQPYGVIVRLQPFQSGGTVVSGEIKL